MSQEEQRLVRSARARLSFRDEEVAAQRAAFRARAFALIGVAALITMLTPWPGPVFYWGLLVLFFVIGYLGYLVSKSPWGRPAHHYAVVFVDFALLAFTLTFPNPLAPFDLPPQASLRFGNFIYFFFLLASLAYVYRPRLVLWGGFSGAVCWTVAVTWLATLPDTVLDAPGDNVAEVFLRLMADPYFVYINVRVQEVGVLMLTAALLALAVKRMRLIAIRKVEAAEQRANLARYFPSQTADLLADKENPFTTPREQQAAVLFADVVGFTTWSETQPPARTIAYLREMHGLLAETIFQRHGTLDKFIGDGLMATFGTPAPGERDATNALHAALDMADRFEAWRATLSEADGGGLSLAIGVQFGPVVVGDVGAESRLEFATLGDVVNVASRLEAATRQHGCRVLVGRALVERVRREAPDDAEVLLGRLEEIGDIAIRGRAAPEFVYALR